MTSNRPGQPSGGPSGSGNAPEPDRKDPPTSSPQDIADRLDAARQASRSPRGAEGSWRSGGTGGPSGLSLGLRMGTDLVAAVIVGGGIGWFLDRWLGTFPILFVIFFLFGAAAGFLNVIRTANEAGMGRADDAD